MAVSNNHHSMKEDCLYGTKSCSWQEAKVILRTIMTDASRNIRRTVLQKALETGLAIRIEITIALALTARIGGRANTNLGIERHSRQDWSHGPNW
jgi:hypothetical protein